MGTTTRKLSSLKQHTLSYCEVHTKIYIFKNCTLTHNYKTNKCTSTWFFHQIASFEVSSFMSTNLQKLETNYWVPTPTAFWFPNVWTLNFGLVTKVGAKQFSIPKGKLETWWKWNTHSNKNENVWKSKKDTLKSFKLHSHIGS